MGDIGTRLTKPRIPHYQMVRLKAARTKGAHVWVSCPSRENGAAVRTMRRTTSRRRYDTNHCREAATKIQTIACGRTG